MNFWKIGSRWSINGNADSSVLDVFRRNNIVFAGSNLNRIINDVKVGDFIAISDGKKLVSVAKVLEEPKPVTEFDISDGDKQRFTYESWVIGVRVHIVDLDEPIPYRIGTFHKMNKHTDLLRRVYEIEPRRFEIDAKTCTLNNYDGNADKTILNIAVKYVIPIYQRPYSWGEAELRKFITDILISYRDREPIFFGTMQFGAKKSIDENMSQQDVIDGQQRLTTILVFLKVLQLKYGDIAKSFDTYFRNNFATEVNNEIQNAYMLQFFEVSDQQALLVLADKQPDNKYAQNARILLELFDDLTAEQGVVFEVNDFLENHFFSNLFFVVIETRASLSKTLQIFDTINTSGLDLQGADVFKIRLYEYLQTEDACDRTKLFQKISSFYEAVDKAREQNITTSVNEILSIYQVFLVGKFDLNQALYSLNVNTFFERLFDQLLGINNHSNFEKNIKSVKINLGDLRAILEMRCRLHRQMPTGITQCEYYLILQSRYQRYWYWIIIFYISYHTEVHFANKRDHLLRKSANCSVFTRYFMPKRSTMCILLCVN